MITRSQKVLLSAILLFGLCGCASDKNKAWTRSKPARNSGDDSAFAAGTAKPPSAATSYGLAKILIGQGRDRDALYVLTRVVREHPKFLPAYNEIAGIYVRSDRLDDAIETLSAALKCAPDDGVLHNNLGMCHFLKGESAAALESFTRAAELSPSNPLYRANRAAALAMVGREAEARTDYYSVLDITATKRNLAILAKARHEHDGQSPTTTPAASEEPPAADAASATTRPVDASAG